MNTLNSYLIHSLAPLVFRSGKPFGSQMSAQDMIFPLPSAAAGLIRSLSITQHNVAPVQENLSNSPVKEAIENSDYQKILAIKSYGVYLVRYQEDDEPTILLPKPANSLYMEKEDGTVELIRLAPAEISEDCGSDLPDHLLHVQTVDEKGHFKEVKGKPKSGINYWSLDDMIKWQYGEVLDYTTIEKNGLTHIPTDIRTHVAIDDNTLSSEDGRLFQTASYDLNYQVKNSQHLVERGFDSTRLGFVVVSEEDLQADLATFGGERRLSKFIPIQMPLFTNTTQTQVDAINQHKGCSLTFITPCVFAKGYLPSWIDETTMTGTLPNSAVKVRLKAAAIDRWQAVSGWDSLLWRPKAMRKAISAGSVYWFEIVNEMDLATLNQLQQPLADDTYDRNDGFGMAIVAPYSFN